jgi:hypothetical protein
MGGEMYVERVVRVLRFVEFDLIRSQDNIRAVRGRSFNIDLDRLAILRRFYVV